MHLLRAPKNVKRTLEYVQGYILCIVDMQRGLIAGREKDLEQVVGASGSFGISQHPDLCPKRFPGRPYGTVLKRLELKQVVFHADIKQQESFWWVTL